MAAKFQARLDATRAVMARHGLTRLVIYGDREHFANLAYLTPVLRCSRFNNICAPARSMVTITDLLKPGSLSFRLA